MKKQLMHFRNIFGFLALIFSFNAVAQNSTVTFTVQDPTGQVFANGTMSYVIVPTGVYIFNGSPLSNTYYSPQTISLDGTGSGTLTLPRNDFITPINSQWLFTACPNASSPCTSVNVTINQASQSISAVINAAVPAIKIPISSVPRAYSDSEVMTSIAAGGIYYNVTLAALRLWNGSAWSTVGSGGGGGVSLVTSSANTLIVTNPTTTPNIEINYAHAGTYTGAQSFSNGAGTPDIIKNYNDPTGGEGEFFYTGATQTGGIVDNTANDLTLWNTDGLMYFCDTIPCNTGRSMVLDLSGTGGETPYASLRFAQTTLGTPFVLTDGQGIWLGAQFPTYISNLSFQQFGTSIASTSSLNIGSIAPILHITGTNTISSLTYSSNNVGSYTNTAVLWVIADAAWSTNTSGNINQAITAVPGQLYIFVYDGTKWSILSPGSSGGSGISGLTANCIPKAATATTLASCSSASDNGTTVTITEPVTISPAGGVGGGHGYTEGTVSSGTAGVDNIQAVSSIHRLEQNPNNTGQTVIPGTSTTAATSGHLVVYAANGYDMQDGGAVPGGGISNITVTIGTTAISANSCSTVATATMTGLATTSTVNFTPNSDVHAVTGWGPVTPGLYIIDWPSATNTLSYYTCNSTGSSITPGSSVTFNVSAR